MTGFKAFLYQGLSVLFFLVVYLFIFLKDPLQKEYAPNTVLILILFLTGALTKRSPWIFIIIVLLLTILLVFSYCFNVSFPFFLEKRIH